MKTRTRYVIIKTFIGLLTHPNLNGLGRILILPPLVHLSSYFLWLFSVMIELPIVAFAYIDSLFVQEFLHWVTIKTQM